MLKRKLNQKYDVCIPPLYKPFHELTHEETEAFYQWHMSHLRERIDYLSSFVSHAMGIRRETINLSPQSLIPVWEWFLSVIKTERTPPERLKELEKEYSSHSIYFIQYLMDQSKDQYTIETELILRDIGMYFGEVFVKNEPCIHWSYYEKPKSDFFVNMPVLLGFEDSSYSPPFKMEFEPVHMAKVQAANIWDGSQKKEDLYNLYTKWSNRYVPHKEK